MSTPSEVQLAQPPQDGISAVTFGLADAASDNLLLVSSWDATVRLYDARANTLLGSYMHDGAVLDCALRAGGGSSGEAVGFSGALDGTVRTFDFRKSTATNGSSSSSSTTSSGRVIGTHGAPVRCVAYSTSRNAVVSGSWDKTVSLWDTRAAAPSGGTAMATAPQPGKVYAMSLCSDGNTLVVGTNERHVLVWDLRNLSAPVQRRESPLKHQTRCVCSSRAADSSWFALSSIEGRVAVEWIDLSPPAQARKFSFKCHRSKPAPAATASESQPTQAIVYPVNALACHPRHTQTFATGGCDGVVNLWDGANKKRLCRLRTYPSSISNLAFNKDGTLLAVASSYTFEHGDIAHEPDAVFLRSIDDSEVKPKARKAKKRKAAGGGGGAAAKK